MLAIAGKTAGPNWLKIFEETNGYTRNNENLKKFHMQRRVLHLVLDINTIHDSLIINKNLYTRTRYTNVPCTKGFNSNCKMYTFK